MGVNILNFGAGASAPALLRWAQIAEGLGYHSVMISDHVALTADVRQRYPEPFFDPFTTLAWLAGQTRQIRLGTTVIVLPYRSPLLMARLVANIDHLSNGRFIFGVGVGGAKLEFEALGVPVSHRGAITNEYLAAMIALWTNEEASFKGRHVSFQNVAGPKPFQSPHPPIWVGGSSDGAIQRAARYGDAWHPILHTLQGVESESLPNMRRYAESAQRPLPAFCPRIRLEITAHAITNADRASGTGNLDQVRSDLETLQAMGAQHVTLDWYTGDPDSTKHHQVGWRMLSVLAEQVLDLPNKALR